MKNKKFLIIVIVGLLLSQSILTISAIETKKINSLDENNSKWTIMVYLDGDNNLEGNAIQDFLEMSDVGSNDEINIVVQFDRSYYYDYTYGNWETTKRFHITNGMEPTSENAIMDIGEANMGDPETLIEFSNWVISNYSSEKYCLIFWDHGSGWKSEDNCFTKHVCDDETDMDYLSLEEIRYALSQIKTNLGKKIELVGFDACLMGMSEVAYEIKNYCKFMTASEQTEPVSGWNYVDSLIDLKNFPQANGEDLGNFFVNSYYGYDITLSTISLNFASFISKLNILADSLKDESIRPYIVTILEKIETFKDIDNIDLYDFAFLITSLIEDVSIKQKAFDLMDEISNIVTSEKHDSLNENANGLAIYFPYYTYDTDYDLILMSQENNWDDFLIWYYNVETSSSPSDPEISGPNAANTYDYHEYSFLSIDPEYDEIYYLIDWGDQVELFLYGPYNSGEEFKISYSWYVQGAYIIRAKAIDGTGAQSEWNTYPISMKKSKTKIILYRNFHYLFEKLFNNLDIIFSK